jgi:hypothetical protein
MGAIKNTDAWVLPQEIFYLIGFMCRLDTGILRNFSVDSEMQDFKTYW